MRKAIPADYRGIHVLPLADEAARRKRAKREHEIHYFEADRDLDETRELAEYKISRVINVHKHRMEDFEFNIKKAIELYKAFYGNPEIGEYTIAQPMKFRVCKKGEIFELPLFKFVMNYAMLILPVEVGCDLSNWKPWVPQMWTNDEWCQRMDEYIRAARPLANMRKICECIEMTKYLLNLWVAIDGDRIGLSISNYEFIEVMNRSEEARKSITCSFDIPEDITPTELEKMTMDRTMDLLDFIGEQTDLSISVYARNNLFNPTQFREYAVHTCYKPSLSGATISYTYPTNIIMGLKDPRAFMVDAYGGRKAEITKLNVSDAGSLERALMMLMSPVRFVDLNYECESQHFRRRYIGTPKDLRKLDGRVFTFEPGSGKYRMIGHNSVDLVGKTVYLKTPITCSHPKRQDGYICSACYGKILASLNCDVHIGRNAAADSADELEQKLLSAKHALKTDTVEVKFDEAFYRYFDLGNGVITFNHEMIEMSSEPREDDGEFYHLWLEFYPENMGKHQDGESRHFDRSFQDIVIYDDRTEERIAISELNGSELYLSPEFNENNFLPKILRRTDEAVIRIPFDDIASGGVVETRSLFEFNYRNNELARPLLTLEKTLFNCKTISDFKDYDECLDTIIPLFVKGGIHIPDYQTELLVSQLIIGADGNPVDWNDPAPRYKFQSINKSISSMQSPITSLLYRDAGKKIAGAFGTYEKRKPDSYSWFLLDNNDDPDSDS